MECASSILSSIFTEIGKYLVKHCIHQANYLFRFKNIVDDLKKEDEDLRSKQLRVQGEVDRARNNTEETEKDVEKWLIDVQNVLEEIQRLKDEIELNKTFLCGRCPNWRWRYKLGRRAVKKTSEMSKLRESGSFSKVAHPTTLSGVEGPKDFISFKPTEDAFSQIMEALKNDNMVGLYGMGGVGKTTLAKKVGKEAKEENLFNEVVMVTVTQNPNVKNIQSQIAKPLGLTFEDEEETLRARRLCLRLKQSEEKILIILDDVWMELELEETIGIPLGDAHKGCTILLTTRQQQVCDSMRCKQRIQLNILSDDEALTLLKKHADICDSPELNAVAKEVVGECGCLPIAIKAIGSALRGKDVDEWKVVSKKLKMSKFPDIETVDKNVYACLRLSYDYLKTKETKSWFLLCSLFPEDYEIDLEELLRYGLGLDLYGVADTIDEARRELRVTINNLKASCLLLDAKEGHVKMHDLVRDVALWITSIRQSNLLNGENVFMVKAGMGLTEWPKHQGLEQCTAISLMENDIKVLPDGLVCPKLKILLLEGNGRVEVSLEFFEEMKALKVASLNWVHLSLNSLQSLTNLVTLQLISCELSDISSIKKLAQLEILRLKGSGIVELPKELEELSKLRMLDIIDCYDLERIPANVIQRLSQLEELYIGSNSFTAWDVEGRSAEQSNASLSELNQLYYLTILSLRINVLLCLPKEFVLPKKLLRYDISVNDDDVESYPKTRTLRIRDIEATSLVAFKALYEKVEYLDLMSIKGCCYHNMVQSVYSTGLNELKRLSIRSFDELECIIDTTQQQDVPSTTFSNLVDLSLKDCDGLREICSGGRPPRGFLEHLETLDIRNCKSMSNSLFPSWVLIQGLRKLKEVTVKECGELEHVFQLEGLCYAKENPFLLSSLESLDLYSLENLRYIWKGPTQQVSLQSLTVVEVESCNKLRYLFTLSLARSLLQLEQLTVSGCLSLEHIVSIKAEENVGGGGGNDVMFPKLRRLQLDGLENFNNFFDSENYSSTWPALQELSLSLPRNSSTFFVAQLEANVLQTSKEECGSLEHIVEIEEAEECGSLDSVGLREICSGGRPPRGFLENLETLKISSCKSMSCLFPSWVLIQSLRKLKEVTVEECGELEDVFQLEGLCYAKENPFLLSSLESLHLWSLQNLRYIWKGPTQQVSLQSLTVVEVESCNKLRYLFTLSLARNLLQLEQLMVVNCHSLEHIVSIKAEENVGGGDGNDVMFPKLRKLQLDGLENFINFFDSENYSSTWPALQELSLNLPLNSTTSFVAQLEANMLQTSKEKLRVLQVGSMSDQLCNSFLAQLIHGFQNLEELKIRFYRVQVLSQLELSLPSLKVLQLWYLEELEWLCKGPTHLLSLPNLKKLEVWHCDRLRHMFSPSLARNLLQLEELSIKDCEELEQIFNEDDAADMTSHREMELPQLQKLTLEGLASLVNFCHVGYHFIFPSLSELEVSECPKLTTRFSVDQNRSVHAEAEAPQTGKEDVDIEQSHLKTTGKIKCWDFDDLQKQLPPYIGK